MKIDDSSDYNWEAYCYHLVTDKIAEKIDLKGGRVFLTQFTWLLGPVAFELVARQCVSGSMWQRKQLTS